MSSPTNNKCFNRQMRILASVCTTPHDSVEVDLYIGDYPKGNPLYGALCSTCKAALQAIILRHAGDPPTCRTIYAESATN